MRSIGYTKNGIFKGVWREVVMKKYTMSMFVIFMIGQVFADHYVTLTCPNGKTKQVESNDAHTGVGSGSEGSWVKQFPYNDQFTRNFTCKLMLNGYEYCGVKTEPSAPKPPATVQAKVRLYDPTKKQGAEVVKSY